MSTSISYDPSLLSVNSLSTSFPVTFEGTVYTSAPASLSTTEKPLFVVGYTGHDQKSQFSIFLQAASGQNATFNYYYASKQTSGLWSAWYPVSLYDTTTGNLTRRSVILVSGTSYTYSSVMYQVDNVQVGALSVFMVTGKSASATPAYDVQVMARDN